MNTRLKSALKGVFFSLPGEAATAGIIAAVTFLYKYQDNYTGFWTLFFPIFAAVVVAAFLLGFDFGGSKPDTRRDYYVPGSAPNVHKWQSSAWYAHETLMEQERQTAAMHRRSD